MNEYKHIFEIVEDKVKVKLPFIHVRIPGDYLTHNIAEIDGQDLRTMGIFYFDVYGEKEKEYDEEDPFKKPNRYFLSLPTFIKMEPSRIFTERDEEKRTVHIFEFGYGDNFLSSTKIKKDWKIVSKMIEILIQGFLPQSIKYENIYKLIKECCYLNDVNLNVADTILEILISELNRDPDNIRTAFRFLINENPSIDTRIAKHVKIDTLGRISNTFAALSSADPKQGLTVSINREKNGEKQIPSTIEEALRNV
jgi:hypothetical protein